MAGYSNITLNVPEGYGYCILVFLASIFVLLWKALQVGKARKLHNVPYPKMYSETNDKFNCVQRAHQNTLEEYPQFVTLLLLGGLEYPLITAAAGTVFLVGRIAYAKGYYTGDPKNRERGSFAIIGLIIMVCTTTKLAFRML